MTWFQLISCIIAGFFTIYYLRALLQPSRYEVAGIGIVTWVISIMVAVISFVGMK